MVPLQSCGGSIFQFVVDVVLHEREGNFVIFRW
jgi:hypothetical protein